MSTSGREFPSAYLGDKFSKPEQGQKDPRAVDTTVV